VEALLFPLAFAYLAKRKTDPTDTTSVLKLSDELAERVIEQRAAPALPQLSPELQLECIVPLSVAAAVQSTSVDTIEREDARRVARGEPSQIIDLSARRKGMRLKHALLRD
jgi:hypothetical protein